MVHTGLYCCSYADDWMSEFDDFVLSQVFEIDDFVVNAYYEIDDFAGDLE